MSHGRQFRPTFQMLLQRPEALEGQPAGKTLPLAGSLAGALATGAAHAGGELIVFVGPRAGRAGAR